MLLLLRSTCCLGCLLLFLPSDSFLQPVGGTTRPCRSRPPSSLLLQPLPELLSLQQPPLLPSLLLLLLLLLPPPRSSTAGVEFLVWYRNLRILKVSLESFHQQMFLTFLICLYRQRHRFTNDSGQSQPSSLVIITVYSVRLMSSLTLLGKNFPH